MKLFFARIVLSCAALLSAGTVFAQAQAPRVAMVTSMGTMVFELDPVRAPVSVANFLAYVQKGHYDGTIFHRILPEFALQGGGYDPQLKPKPGGAPIINEARNGLKNVRGTVAMARFRAPDTATTEFFINVVDNAFLDHVAVPPEGITVTRGNRQVRVQAQEAESVFGYAVFGKVVEGMDVVDRIRRVETRPAGPHQNVPTTTVLIERATVLNPK